MDKAKWKGEYGQSKSGNFFIIDTIPVPHPYCITPRHVAVASDQYSGILGDAAIEGAEKQGAKCDICRERNKRHGDPVLSFKDHKTALLVGCKAELKGNDGKVNEELHEWLLSIKDEATRHDYAGFAFLDPRATKHYKPA